MTLSRPLGGQSLGVVCWHFVPGGWNWNLPDHSLPFSGKVILVHMKPQPSGCLEPVTLPTPSSLGARRGGCTLLGTVVCRGSPSGCACPSPLSFPTESAVRPVVSHRPRLQQGPWSSLGSMGLNLFFPALGKTWCCSCLASCRVSLGCGPCPHLTAGERLRP